MQAKRMVTIFSLMLLTIEFISNVHAPLPANPVEYQGIGVIVNLTFPEEAHPQDSIYHNLTIKAQTALSSLNITLYVYAPVESAWQPIDPPQNIPWQFPLTANQSLPPAEVLFILPENTNGTLKCTLEIQTNTVNHASLTFYTTQVRTQTYSELFMAYSSLLANYVSLNLTYNELNSNYIALNSTYSLLKANYTNLNATYTSLFTQNDALQTNHIALTSAYDSLQNKFNETQANMRDLQSECTAVEGERNNLQTLNNSWQKNYTKLRSDYNSLNETYNTLNNTYNDLFGNYTELADQSGKMTSGQTSYQIIIYIFLAAIIGLIALIIYIKKKEPEPYMVIRKETVAIKPEEEKKE